ncbi:Transposase IS4 [Popillia japonica]|uniref:Transposase IS4 n=1 Tax=Popillia japonica TaxID=7064 RepID=A0AAW1IW73_POPJA
MSKIPHSKHLSIDEQMIPFTGTSFKQYVKSKPNPVGLKIFVLATPQSLVLDFVIYQGVSTWPSGKLGPELGFDGSVVKRLRDHVNPRPTIFMDRYFTTLSLFDYLKSKVIYAVGAILSNSLPGNVRQYVTERPRNLSGTRKSR